MAVASSSGPDTRLVLQGLPTYQIWEVAEAKLMLRALGECAGFEHALLRPNGTRVASRLGNSLTLPALIRQHRIYIVTTGVCC